MNVTVPAIATDSLLADPGSSSLFVSSSSSLAEHDYGDHRTRSRVWELEVKDSSNSGAKAGFDERPSADGNSVRIPGQSRPVLGHAVRGFGRIIG